MVTVNLARLLDSLTMAAYELAVEGMACTGCEERVANAAGQVSGVDSVDVDHEAGTVEVAGAGETEAAVRAAIADAGYDVRD